MEISPGEDGIPLLSTSKIRTYGAGGFLLTPTDEAGGCPRLYRKKYVEKAISAEKRSDVLLYGSTIHRALYLMEEEAIGPEEALERSWPAALDLSYWNEAKTDLASYMERGGPMNKYGTLAVEVDLKAHLYDDEDFGPIWFRGIIDWTGIDVDQPQILHFADYKTNRFPPSKDDVAGDVQLKSYDWLLRQNWKALGLAGRPQIVTHLDAIKWFDIEHRFSQSEIDAWQEWAIAIARRILRDEEGRPSLNPGCNWCPVKHSCPEYQKLPETGVTLAERLAGSDVKTLWAWRNDAAQTVKALKAGMDEVDAAIAEAVEVGKGRLQIRDTVWEIDVDWGNELDVRRLHAEMGDDFYRVASASKTAVNKWLSAVEAPDDLSHRVESCWTRQPVGTKIKRRKAKKEEMVDDGEG